MNSDLVSEILASLSGKLPRMSEEEAADYLHRLSTKVYPRPFACEEMTLAESIRNFSKRQSPKVISKLPDRFAPFSQNFFLTPGLHVVAGMTGHGKTFWAMEWARFTEGNTLLLSLEMSWEDLAAREITQISEIPLKDLYLQSLTDNQKAILQSKDYGPLENIHFRNYGSMDWSAIRWPLEADIDRLKPKLLIIDFIQLLEDTSQDDDRLSRVYQELCRRLRFQAIRNNFAIIVLSQVNRNTYNQARNISMIEKLNYLPIGVEALKESGGIAEAADTVQFVTLLGKLPGCPSQYQRMMQISVEKSRALGPQKPALFQIDYATMKFSK